MLDVGCSLVGDESLLLTPTSKPMRSPSPNASSCRPQQMNAEDGRVSRDVMPKSPPCPNDEACNDRTGLCVPAKPAILHARRDFAALNLGTLYRSA